MTTDEAIELAAFYYGGALSCNDCEYMPCGEYLARQPAAVYDDVAFGKWLLDHQWDFRWVEHEHEGQAGIVYLPFTEGLARQPRSVSWSFSLLCPKCRTHRGIESDKKENSRSK